MGLFDKMFGGRQESSPSVATEKNTVYAPVSGTAVPLAEIGDPVFAEGVLGQGCGVIPDSETVLAPFHGTVIQIADTKHAVCVRSDDGVEVLVHVGLDTVSMNGTGFNVLVKEEDKVKCGQKLMTFSKKAISEAGLKDTVAVIVINTEEYEAITLEKEGVVAASEKLITIK